MAISSCSGDVPDTAAVEKNTASSSSQQLDNSGELPGALKDYYTAEKSLSQPTVKVEKEDDDSDSFANFVAQELHEHEDDNTTSVSSTSPAGSPTIPVPQSEVLPGGLISNLAAVSGIDMEALNIPVDECIAAVSVGYYICIVTILEDVYTKIFHCLL